MRKVLLILTLCGNTALFSNHNIEPGNIQLVLSRNNKVFQKCTYSESDWYKLYNDLNSGNGEKVNFALEKMIQFLPPDGIKSIVNYYQRFSEESIKQKAIQTIGAYKTPEAEIALSKLLLSSLSDPTFVDIADELKVVHILETEKEKIKYRPVSDNLITLFTSLAESKSLIDNHKGIVILIMGDLKEKRFLPVLTRLKSDNKEFVRNLAKLILEMNFKEQSPQK